MEIEDEAAEEEQSGDVGGQDRVGDVHVGRRGGDEVGEHDADHERDEVDHPEEEERALERDGVEGRRRDADRHDAGDEELVHLRVGRV